MKKAPISFICSRSCGLPHCLRILNPISSLNSIPQLSYTPPCYSE